MMKRKAVKRIMAIFIVAITIIINSNIIAEANNDGQKTFDIMFMHDVHSHLESFNTIIDGKDANIGGLARIKTLINQQKEKNPNTLVVDGGDFSMGTLYQTLFESDASELRMLGEIGVEVTTFGNHEYDYRSKGLYNMLESAKNSGEALPQIVVSNIDKSVTNEGAELLMKGMDDYGVEEYTIIKKGDVKIAVFGIFGKDALKCAPTCELGFVDPIESAKETVKKIKENEEPDMIVCLSHSGVNENVDKSEDEQLAMKVPDIDVIISAHSHTESKEAKIHGNTIVVSCGEYGKNLGSLSLKQKEDGRWELENYELIRIDNSIEEDTATKEKIDYFGELIDEKYLSKYGYTKDEIVGNSLWSFNPLKDMSYIHEEMQLGNILADSYIYTVSQINGKDGEKPDVAIVPSGIIRETIVTGNISVNDIFNIFPLGIGKDKTVGYPLINVYLTGSELKTLCEVDASVSDLMKTARLFMSGLSFEFNPNRLILNKVTDTYITDLDGNRTELEDDKLYSVLSDLYSAQMLSSVTDMSKGILKIQPKFKDGTIIETQDDFENCIVYDGENELKLWDAVARYISSFDKDNNGISQISEYYKTTHDRKIVNDSKSIKSLLEKPNKIAIALVVIIIVFIILIVVIVRIVIKVMKKRKIKQ